MHIKTINRKKGVVYRVHVKRHGRTKTRTFKRKIDARNWGEKMELLQQSGGRSHLTFKELAAEWLANHSKTKNAVATYVTYASQLQRILPVLGDRRIEDLSYSDVERLVASLKSSSSRGNLTINRHTKVVRTVMNYALRKGDVLINPVKKDHFLPEKKSGFNYWSQAEADGFIAYAEEKYRSLHPHVLLVYSLALNAGLRWGEIAALQWDSVLLRAEPHLAIQRTYCGKSRKILETTKSGKARYVGISLALLKPLRQAFEERPPGCALVVHGETGKCLDEHNFRKRHFMPDLEAAGVTRIRFHDLRHTYASLFMMNGGNLFTLQSILGHQSPQMTQRYAHLSKDHILSHRDLVMVGKRDNILHVDFKDQRLA